MARFLISTFSEVGHINPFLPIARKLVERGHEVWWYTGKSAQSRVEATGARYVPMVAGFDLSDEKTFPQSLLEKRKKVPDPIKLIFDIKHLFIDTVLLQLKDYEDILRQFPADVFLSDWVFNGASWLHEKGGPPWAVLGITNFFFKSRDTAPFGLGMQPNSSPLGRLRNGLLYWVFERVLLRTVTCYMNNARASIGLLPSQKGCFNDFNLSPFLYLQGTVPGFEYPRSDLPPQVHFVGPFLPSPPADFTFPTWWDELKGNRPVILVTQGTVRNDKPEDLIVPTLQALANEDVLVVAMTGGTPIKLAQYPANAIIEQNYVPFSHLLPHVDVMVTNGGYGGVQMALANGVPVVAAGKTDDRPETCGRVQWSGVGIDVKTNNPKPKQIKDAVKKILTSSQYRQKAKLLQAEIACYDAPTLAATLLEQLVATQQPVLRTQQTVTQEFERNMSSI